MNLRNIICCFVVIFIESAYASRKTGRKNKIFSIDTDFPQKTDLESYLTALDKTVKYYITNPNDIDVNSVFGFFLMNVNLNSALRKKAQDLPLLLANRFKNVVEKNVRIVAYFRMMSAQSQVQTSHHKKLKQLSTLFSNESYWVEQTKQVDGEQVIETPSLGPQDILLHFSSWPEYKEEIDNLGRITPSFALTEKCVITVAENPAHYGESNRNCTMPKDCLTSIFTGSDIGFGLTNRLLILIQARLGRRCNVFSSKQDADMVDKLCSSCYKESLFLSMNKYDPLPLFIEQITLCTLNGNVEFLRRDWISYILQLQNEYGCFTESIFYARNKRRPAKPIPPERWNIDRGNQANSDTHCHGTTSAGAVAIISAAIKYILEMYF